MATDDSSGQESDFGGWLRVWRHRNRLTQALVADRLGYDVTYIAKIEGGARPPSRAFMARLSLLSGLPEEKIGHSSMVDLAGPSLPLPADPLVGRDDAIEGITRLLDGSARCVTLVGPPGIGKSRLALELAVRLDQDSPGRTVWIPLVDVSDPEDIGSRFARALGLPDSNLDPVEAVLRRNRDNDALVIFDNFEHVMEARGLVSRIIAETKMKILVTSREALGLLSEYVVPIRSLSFPNPSDRPSIERVAASSAVELFVLRAKMAHPDFRLTDANYGDVLRACARLDGLPLAIVLAAGNVNAFGASGLVDQLNDRLDVLYGAPADMPHHHETLEIAIRWSWDRLDSEEQELLATAAAFAGGFTERALAEVSGLEIWHVRSLLVQLCRKSLIEARPESRGGPRFELLDTIKAFAYYRLVGSDQLEKVQRRHAMYFSAVANDLGRRFGLDQFRCVLTFAEEFENLQLTFDWSLRHEPRSALGLASDLWRLFLLRDIPSGRRWLTVALGADVGATPERATALAAAGALGWITGHAQSAAVMLDEAETLAEQLGLDDVACLALVNKGALAEQLAHLDDSEHCFTKALAGYKRLGDTRGRALALNGLGMVSRRRGDIARAWPLWTEAAAVFRAVGDGTNEAIALGNLAWAAEVGGRLDEAQEISHRCRQVQISIGDVRGLAATTAALGRIAYRRGEFEDARRLHLEALVAFRQLGDLPWVASTFLALSALHDRTGRHESAARLLGAAEALWDETGIRPREEEQALVGAVGEECRAQLGDSGFARAMTIGRVLTLDESVEVVERLGR